MNAAKFAEHYECKLEPGFDPANATQTLNRWIATETTRAARAITDAIEAYKFNEAANAAYFGVREEQVVDVVARWILTGTAPGEIR